MDNLKEVSKRHNKDPWRDAIFIVAAVVLTALSIGSVTKKAAGSAPHHQWTLTVVENPELAK
ncbi:MAG: hypothetical protein ACM31C_15730 [Acidobacteriota bacterium]